MLTSRSNGGTVVTSAPWSRIRPSVGSSKPAIIRSVVVLPEPDGPSIEKNSPSQTSRSMPATATTGYALAGIDELGHAPTGIVVAEALDDAFEPDRDRSAVVAGSIAPGLEVGIAKRDLGLGRDRPGRAAADPGPPHCAARARSVSSNDRRRSVRRVIDFAPCSPSPPRRAWLPSPWSRSRPAPARPAGPPRADAADRARRARRRRARSTSSPRTTRSCPTRVDLVPGETVLLHVINGGLEVHEAVIGDAAVQDAWEVAEAATAGRTARADAGRQRPARRRRPADRRRLRASGSTSSGRSRPTAPADAGAWVVGCHIPGHWARGMQVPVRWVRRAAS